MYGCPTTFFVLHCHGKDDLVSRPRRPTNYKMLTRDEVPVRHMLQQKVLVVSSNGVAERSQIKRSDTLVRARRCTGQRYYLVSCRQIFRISPRLQEILTTFFRGFI